MSPSDENAPALPSARSGRCPYDPAPDQLAWLGDGGLKLVVWRDLPVRAVNRFEDVRTAMAHRFVSSHVRGSDVGRAFGDVEGLPISFAQQDDPEHARLRTLLGQEFSMKSVRALRPQLQAIADDLIDEMIAKGPGADLVTAYGLPIPSRAICLILGVPYTDHDFFQEQSAIGFQADASPEERMGSAIALFEYLQRLIHQKQDADRSDDLISRVAHDHVAAGDLSADDLAVSCMALLTAGHETTANMIALGTLVLLEHPEVAARIRAGDDAQVVSNTTEELMRYLTIVHDLVVRVVKDDVTVAGVDVQAGEGLFMNLAVANRDPRYFEHPDTFDVDRRRRGHVAFGWGIHQCLGQILARAELDIAYATLLRRLPDLRLAVPPSELDFRHDMSTYGVHALPVTWG